MGIFTLDNLERDSGTGREMAEIRDFPDLAQRLRCCDQAAAETDRPQNWSKTMQFVRNSLFTRSDTLFGVCQALGQDFGISPNWFRIGIAGVVIVNLKAALAVYAGLAVLVLLSRAIYPSRRAEAPVEADAQVAAQPEVTVAETPRQAPAMAEAA